MEDMCAVFAVSGRRSKEWKTQWGINYIMWVHRPGNLVSILISLTSHRISLRSPPDCISTSLYNCHCSGPQNLGCSYLMGLWHG